MIRLLCFLLIFGIASGHEMSLVAKDYIPDPWQGHYFDLSQDLNSTNAISAGRIGGVFAAISPGTAYYHQARSCWGHDGLVLDEIGILDANGSKIHYVRFNRTYVGYLVASHNDSGFCLDSIQNRDDLLYPQSTDYVATWWLMGLSLGEIRSQANKTIDLLRTKDAAIDLTGRNGLPSAFVKSFAWGPGSITFFMNSTDFSGSIDITLIEWVGANATKRHLVVPLLPEITIKTDADKLVAYFGRPADKVYAERGYP